MLFKCVTSHMCNLDIDLGRYVSVNSVPQNKLETCGILGKDIIIIVHAKYNIITMVNCLNIYLGIYIRVTYLDIIIINM